MWIPENRSDTPPPVPHPPAVPSPAPESRIPFEGKRKSVRASERARGGSPIRLSRLHFEPQLEPRHIQFLTGDRSDASVVPNRARRRTLPSGFHGIPSRRPGGSTDWDNRDSHVAFAGGVACEITARYTHAVEDVARDSRSLEAIDPRNRSDSVTPVRGSCESCDKTNRDKCRKITQSNIYNQLFLILILSIRFAYHSDLFSEVYKNLDFSVINKRI